MIDKTEWEAQWEESSFERYYGIEKYLALNRKLMELFKLYLPKGSNKILEIGCAKGKDLIYFAQDFGYKLYGIDYSNHGVTSAKRNIRIAGLEADIRCEDMFNTSFEPESFDIVYSMGLIEHFDNPSNAIDAHIKLLKKDGILILTVPNFDKSIYRTINKWMGKWEGITETHNIGLLNKKSLRNSIMGKGLKLLSIGYLGVVDLDLIFCRLKISNFWTIVLNAINQVVCYSLYIAPTSSYFSPYIVLIARKR
jgi:2-polyprenyl-3-methyl-5-hydroxy-6-metoxy-1,4-benzoquinol methylase